MATPGVRKDVLAKVLGLGRYDELAERARLTGDATHARSSSATAVNIDRLRERAGKAAETRAALAEAERELAEAVTYVNGLAERLQLLRGKVAHLERRQAEREEQDAAGASARASGRPRRKQEAARSQPASRRVAAAPSSAPREIEQGVAALQGAREHERSLAEAARQAYALQTQLAPLENAIGQARARLESDIQSQRQHVDTQLTPRAESLPSIQRQQDELTARRAAMERPPGRRGAGRGIAAATRAGGGNAPAGERAVAAGRYADARQARPCSTTSTRTARACPLCNSTLGPDGVVRIRESYEREIAEQRRALRRAEATRGANWSGRPPRPRRARSARRANSPPSSSASRRSRAA